MTRWLDDDEMAFWRAFTVASGRLTTAIDADLRAESGLTLDDYEVLVHLSEAPERRVRMSELADRVVQSRSRLTQRIDRMVARGLVERQQCPDDRRGTFAALTDDGFAVLEAAAPAHVESVRRHLLDHLAPTQIRAGADLFGTVLDMRARRGQAPSGIQVEGVTPAAPEGA
ncbi:MAG: MarR family transcriptional regulator [Acidimicrobiaceae bacterium]|nr:MarR family transcriptional regulator [Acidimicrobiaceae bacterium]